MKIKEHLEKNKEFYKKWLVDNEQGMIEFKILPYLQDIENGIFVEAGAYDGLFQSNTKILEDLGWSGVLIEPSVNSYELCKLNRKCIVENYGLVSFDYKDEFVYGMFNGTPRSGISKDGNNPTKVNAKTLTSILLEKNITHVDFLSLDVEGYELEVLKGVDFNLISFNFLLMEVNYDSYSLEDMVDFLAEKGFKLISNISNFRFDNTPGWPGTHQDFLFKKI